MISRRDDAGVVDTTSRRSNEEISHFLASRRAGEFEQTSALLVAHDASASHRSSRLESCPTALRSIDGSSNPVPGGLTFVEAFDKKDRYYFMGELKDRKEGVVQENLPNALFRVKFGEDIVLAHLSGRMRLYYIKILPGDRVIVEFSPYDKTKGRIVQRLK